MRVVLDTSVVIAGFRSADGASRRWLEASLRQEVTLLLSVPLVLQYEEVLLRSQNMAAHGLTGAEIATLLDGICSVAEAVELSYLWRPLLRDPDDEMVLETAVLGRADTLLTFNIRDFAGSESVGVTPQRPGPAWRKLLGG